jgi:hypothetical protein
MAMPKGADSLVFLRYTWLVSHFLALMCPHGSSTVEKYEKEKYENVLRYI